MAREGSYRGITREWQVSFRETYADGFRWEMEIPFRGGSPDMVAKRAIAWNRRAPGLTEHGAMVAFEVHVEPAES